MGHKHLTKIGVEGIKSDQQEILVAEMIFSFEFQEKNSISLQ
jgi:hypothetical protein